MSTNQNQHIFNFKRKLKDLKSLHLGFVREASPVRGFLNKWSGKDDYLYKEYQRLTDEILGYIEDSDLQVEAKESYLTWETFQSTQKGPTAPYDASALDRLVSEASVPNYHIDDNIWDLVEEVAASLLEYLKKFAKIDVLSLKPAELWMELPRGTIRGYPYIRKGRDVDHLITADGGNTPLSAVQFMESSDTLVCSPGFRIQGSPGSNEAKVRLVFIPSVSSQYFDNAFISASMSQLKSCPIFAAWQGKDERVKTIVDQNIEAQRIDHVRIQLDWSKFDKQVHPKFQMLLGKFYEAFAFSGKDLVRRRNEQFNKLLLSQHIYLGDSKGNVHKLSVPFQLISGRKGTQHDGSLIGLILQGLFYKMMFGKQIPWHLTNQAGDDSLFPVPTHALTDLGYDGVLEKISEINDKVGFLLNPKKAYPNSDSAFLQKLYKPEVGIYGAGSFTRSLASFIWKEKFSKPIKGVRRLWALELISQISILSEPFSKSVAHIHGVAEILSKWWLDHDDYLNSVMQFLGNNLSPHNLFVTLVRLVGLSKDELLEELGISSYDHTGFSEALDSQDFGEVFPILRYLVSNFKPGREYPDISELVDVETVHDILDSFSGE